MTLSREKYDEIKFKYTFTESEAEDAFNFVHDVLAAEADLLQEKEPAAWATIQRLNETAYTVFEAGSDISNDCFDEE